MVERYFAGLRGRRFCLAFASRSAATYPPRCCTRARRFFGRKRANAGGSDGRHVEAVGSGDGGTSRRVFSGAALGHITDAKAHRTGGASAGGHCQAHDRSFDGLARRVARQLLSTGAGLGAALLRVMRHRDRRRMRRTEAEHLGLKASATMPARSGSAVGRFPHFFIAGGYSLYFLLGVCPRFTRLPDGAVRQGTSDEGGC